MKLKGVKCENWLYLRELLLLSATKSLLCNISSREAESMQNILS